MEAEKQRCNKLKSTAQQKKTAMKLLNDKDYTKTEIAKKVNVNRTTLYRWIEEKKEQVQTLAPDVKIKLWESESVKDMHLASIARESLREDLENVLKPVSVDTKRAIMHSASVVAGIKWDKSRLEAGQGVSNDVHAIMINVFERRQPQDVVIDGDKGVIEVKRDNNT